MSGNDTKDIIISRLRNKLNIKMKRNCTLSPNSN